MSKSHVPIACPTTARSQPPLPLGGRLSSRFQAKAAVAAYGLMVTEREQGLEGDVSPRHTARTMSAPAILDQALLDQFDARLRALGAAIVDVWAPGLSDDAIDALVGPLGIDLPEEARLWWRWHNGVKAGAPRRERCILPERELYSLESALDGCTEWWGALPELWAMNKKLLRPVGELPVIWIDVGGPRQEPVEIYTQNDGSQPPQLVLASMGQLISIWTQLIDDGALIVAADGSWERAAGVPLPPEVAQLQVV